MNSKISELKNLLKECRIPAHRKRIKIDLNSYLEIKRLLELEK